MNRAWREGVTSAWLGFALSALFFYPLASTLDSGIYFLHWQRRDMVETLLALAILASAFGLAVHAISRRPGRGATVGLCFVAVLPLTSFVAGVSRQLPVFAASLQSAWESPAIRFGVPAVVALLIVTAFIRRPDALGRWVRGLLAVLSPVSFVVLGSVIGSAAHPAVTRVSHEPSTSSGATAGAKARCASVLALLFDELSFTYLYDYDGAAVRAEYPSIRNLSDAATTYTSVTAPAVDTLTSMPGFLGVRRGLAIRTAPTARIEGAGTYFDATAPDGLFSVARRLGYETEMAGYYLPYCDLLADSVDRCLSLSFYNVASTAERFSPLNPVLTTFILWPRQFPLGLIKNVPFGRLQRQLVEKTRAFAERPLDPTKTVFRFVHFSVPHLPFVFTRDGFHPPFDPLRTSPDTAYVQQIGYVDRLVGEIVERLKRSGTFDRTTIVILADHGYRFGGRERDKAHIPFIAKMAGQRATESVSAPRAGEVLLPEILERSCVPEAGAFGTMAPD